MALSVGNATAFSYANDGSGSNIVKSHNHNGTALLVFWAGGYGSGGATATCDFNGTSIPELDHNSEPGTRPHYGFGKESLATGTHNVTIAMSAVVNCRGWIVS